MEEFLAMISGGDAGLSAGSGCGRPGCANCGPGGAERRAEERLNQLNRIKSRLVVARLESNTQVAKCTKQSEWLAGFATTVADYCDELETIKNNWTGMSAAERALFPEFTTTSDVAHVINLYGALVKQLGAVIHTAKFITSVYPPAPPETTESDDSSSSTTSEEKMNTDAEAAEAAVDEKISTNQ